MRSMFASFVLAALCLHSLYAFPADNSKSTVSSSTIATAATSTGSSPKEDKLSARFGAYEDGIVFPGVATKMLGASESSSSSLSSSSPLSPSHSSSSSSSFASSSNDATSNEPPHPPHYEYPRGGPDSRPCTCCKSAPSCGGKSGVIRGPIGNFPPPPPFGGRPFPFPGFNGGSFSGSKSSSSSFANQNFGGNYYPIGGYPNDFQSPPTYVIPSYPLGSGSSSTSSSFSGYPGLPSQGLPGILDGPFGTNFPIQQGGSSSSSASSSSSSSSAGGLGGSSSWSSSKSSSGTKTALRPNPPPQVATPEFSIPDGLCRSSSGC